MYICIYQNGKKQPKTKNHDSSRIKNWGHFQKTRTYL